MHLLIMISVWKSKCLVDFKPTALVGKLQMSTDFENNGVLNYE